MATPTSRALPRPVEGRTGWRVGAGAAALTLVAAGWVKRWTTDDAFINYRIVDQFLAGNGPVFNEGERVETYTSALWLALLVVGDVLLPLPIEYVAIVLSLSLVAVGIVAMSAASRRLLAGAGGEGAVWVPAGVLVLVALPPMWDFAAAGLETGLALAWTGLLAMGLARAAENPEDVPSWALVAAGVAPLVRPDAAIAGGFVGLYIVVGTARAVGWRTAARQVALAAALPLAYQLFRMAYFAALVPNTALAKQAAVPHVEEGWAYLVDFVTAYWLWLPVSLLALWAVLGTRALPTPQRVALAVLPAAGALHALYIVRAGGDYIHARLLLLPLFAILAPVATVPVRRSWAAVPMVAVALWALVSAGTLRNHGHVEVNRTLIGNGRGAFDSFENPVTAEDQGWGKDSDRARRLRNHVVAVAEQELDVSAPSGLRTPAVALHGVGVSGYSLGIDVYVVDRLGLGDPLTSRFRLTEPGFIAHEKPIPRSWLAARLSTGPLEEDDLGLDGFASPLYESPTGRFDHDTAVARTVLACRPLRELREATTEPLTLGRALSNLWRAPGLTRLQVAPSPEQARSELC